MNDIPSRELMDAYNIPSTPAWYEIVNQDLVNADEVDIWCIREQTTCDYLFKDFDYPKRLILIRSK